MSAAYQCDACGKLYKPNSEEGWGPVPGMLLMFLIWMIQKN